LANSFSILYPEVSKGVSMDILTFAQQAQDEVTKLHQEIDGQKKGLDLRMARIKKRESEIAERDKQLGEWEKVLTKKYDEVSRIENARLLEMRANDQETKAQIKLAEANKTLEAAKKQLAEAALREQQVLDRELAVTTREKEFRTKLQQEFAQSLVAGITGRR